MGKLIIPNQILVGGQANGQLDQYYGNADTASHTVTAATLQNLSSAYVIPAGEATTASAYELCCGGTGTWGSTQQALSVDVHLNAASLHSPRQIASSVLAASAPFVWSACLKLICLDGVSLWEGSWSMEGNQTANPGTNAIFVIGDSALTSAVSASVASAINPVVFVAEWASTTGAPSITCSWTTFSKIS